MLPAQTPPPIFNMWMCVGLIISSLPALAAGQVSASRDRDKRQGSIITLAVCCFVYHACDSVTDSGITASRPLQVFSPWGILAGAFFVASMACTLFAIKLLGLSTASGVWCGTAGAHTAGPHLMMLHSLSHVQQAAAPPQLPGRCSDIRHAFRHAPDAWAATLQWW